MGCNYPSGRCVFTYSTIQPLFSAAFGQEVRNIAGLPDWVNADRFDIETRAAGPITREQAALMFQSLFADRLKLKFHKETKEIPGLALVVAGATPRLTKAQDQQPQSAKDQNTTIELFDAETMNPTPRPSTTGRMALLKTQKSSMAWLANFLSRIGFADREIVDQTYLPGYYGFELRWQPESNSSVTVDRTGPTFSTALEEQLGLKLQSKRVPVEFLVIDRLEKPTAN